MEVYEHYKDSGVPWIDKIPQLWTVDRFSMSFKFSRGLDIKKRDLEAAGIPVLSYGQIHAKHNPVVTISPDLVRFIPADKIGGGNLEDARLREGDLVFADTSEDVHGAGNFSRSDGSQMIHAGYHTLLARPRETYEHKYFAYLFSSEAWRHQIRRAVQGVKVYSITQGVFKHAQLLRPPVETQDAIVAFLDAKTAEIDVVVEKLRRQRALLERYKRELIAHTVTKGLNPESPMKDSEYEFIGAYPADWQNRPLFDICDQVKLDNSELQTNVALQFKNGSIIAKPDWDDSPQSLDILSGYTLVSPGMIVINGLNLNYDFKTKRIGLVKNNGAITSAYIVISPHRDIESRYLNYLFKSIDAQKALHGMTEGVRKILNWKDIRRLTLPMPNSSQQIAIANYLDTKTAEIDSLIANIDRQIALLGAYRKQVINDVVTGKVWVSEEVA
ncbi:hypothetical protein ACU6QD_04945 [Corynebacterium glucuronolyticum]